MCYLWLACIFFGRCGGGVFIELSRQKGEQEIRSREAFAGRSVQYFFLLQLFFKCRLGKYRRCTVSPLVL